jgi:hypothetical protein
VPTQTQPTGAVPAKGDQASLANGTELQVKERDFVFDYTMDQTSIFFAISPC